MDDRELLRARWFTFAALVLLFSFYLLTQAPWARWISVFIASLTAGLLTAVLEFWLRLSLRRAAAGQLLDEERQLQEHLRQQVQFVLALQRKFLDAHSEKEILVAMLEACLASTRASGASFIPYDEWGQSLPALTLGTVPAPNQVIFTQRLGAPETRQVCKNCELKHGQPGCILIERDHQPPAYSECFPLVSAGRELGMVNIFFENKTTLTGDLRQFITETLHSAGQALQALRARDKEVAALLYLQTATTSKSDLAALLASLVENIRKTLDVGFALLYIPGGIPGQILSGPKMFASQDQAEAGLNSMPDQAFLDGIWQSVLASGHSLALENYPPDKKSSGQTLYAVPLNWQDQGPEGMLLLGSSIGQVFALRHQSLLETLAGQAALLIQNARLMVQLEYQAVVDERTRLAREIHDGLAQTLAFLKMQSSQMQMFLARGDIERLTSMLQSNHRTLADAYLDARQAIENLRRNPSSNLSGWVRQVASEYESSSGQKVNLSEFALEVDYPANVQAQLIRIIQEALNNIRKHAQAEQVTLRGSQNRDSLVIEICDNGRGFSPEQVGGNARFGLRGMRERAESIGADFQIASQPGSGTVVSLRIPIAVKEDL